MYVGDGYIIDAPHTGADVERIPENSDWYAQNEDGAVRPSEACSSTASSGPGRQACQAGA